eukprot:gene23732-9288_t
MASSSMCMRGQMNLSVASSRSSRVVPRAVCVYDLSRPKCIDPPDSVVVSESTFLTLVGTSPNSGPRLPSEDLTSDPRIPMSPSSAKAQALILWWLRDSRE